MIKSFKHPFERQDAWNDGPELQDFMGREGAPAIARRHLAFGGGKTGTSTQNQTSTTSAPSNVTSWATNAYNTALSASQQPFQTYSGQFVAPVNDQQNTGISGINSAAGMYSPYGQAATSTLSPYYGAATSTLGQGLSAGQGLTGSAVGMTAANANLNPNSISQWESPYIQNVVNSTEAQQNFQNQQQQSALTGNAVQAGAFGGDRAGVASANLSYMQNLANQPVIANLYNQGYNTALGAAQTQQQTGLQAANQIGALGNQYYNQGLGASQQYGALGSNLSSAYSNLGTTAQTNALNAANAQLSAGTLQQQTSQAQDTALYNQFLQQQAYPFQTSQFLTNAVDSVAPIFGTTTSASGSSTTPMSFFRRGGRVGLSAGNDAGEIWRIARAGGGGLSANDNSLADLIAAHQQMYAPMAAAASGGQGPYGMGLSAGSGNHQMSSSPLMSFQQQQKSNGVGAAMQGANQAVQFGENVGNLYKAGKGAAVGTAAGTDAKGNPTPASGGLFGYGGTWGASNPNSSPGGGLSGSNVVPFPNPTNEPVLPDGTPISDIDYARGGRAGLAYGGIPYADQISDPIVPDDIASPSLAAELGSPLMGMSSASPKSSGLSAGMSDLNSLVSLGSNVAGAAGGIGDALSGAAAFLGLNRGGRIHKDGGGGLSDGADVAAPPANPDDDLINPDRVAKIETGGGTDRNPLFPQEQGGPRGPHQFISSTWGQYVGEHPGEFANMTPDQVDASRTNPEISRKATLWYAGKNKPILEAAGIPATPENLYLAHGQGGAGAAALLSNPKAGAVEALAPVYLTQAGGDMDKARSIALRAVTDNGGRADMSAGDFAGLFKSRYSGAKGGLSANSTAPDFGQGNPVVAPQGLGAADPQQSWWDKDTGGLSGTERAVISGLTGLAGMASSPSRFLGSAIAQGLGAGAQEYGNLAQKGMALDIGKQQANTAQAAKSLEVAKFRQGQFAPRTDPKTGALMYFDKMSGQMLTPAQYQQAMGGLLNALPGTQTGAGLSASMSPSARPSAPPAVGVKPIAPIQVKTPTLPDGTPISDDAPRESATPATVSPPTASVASPASNVDRETDPTYLFSEANRLNALAQTADYNDDKDQAAGFRAQAEQMTKRATEAAAVSEKAKVLPQAQGEALKATYASQRKAIDLAQAEATNATQTKQQAQSLMGLMFDKDGKPQINGGPIGPEVSKFAAIAQQAGFSPEFVKELTGTNAEDASAMQKFSSIMASELAKQELAGSPVRQQEFVQFMKSVPSDQILPQAFKWIIEHSIIPKAQAQMGAYETIADSDPTKDNVQKKLYEYARDNPWYRPGAPSDVSAYSTQSVPPKEAGVAKSTGITPAEAAAELARRKAAKGAQ